jgi:hypothetical protein
VKGRLPLFVILGSSLTFLVSLYLTWVSAGAPLTRIGVLSVLNLFSSNALDGWGPFGQAAALAAVALALLAIVSLIRPTLEAALPIGGCAIALAVLALVNIADLRTQGIYRAGYYGRLSAHLTTGAYMGGAAALVALLCAAWVSHDEISERGRAAAATLLTIGLVAAYVLPTLSVHNTHSLTGAVGIQFVEAGGYGTAIMLLIASFGLTFWFGASPPIRRISAALVVLVLVVGGFSILGTHIHWPYETWLAIGCAAGLLALAVGTSGQRRVTWPARHDAIALAGAALLLASLFLNWEKECPPSPSGACYVFNGWSFGLTGGLVGIFVVLLLGFRRLSPELAVTAAIYVFTAGLSVTAGEFVSLGYGAFLGFAGAALLLLGVGLQLPRKLPRPGARLIPVAVVVVFLAVTAGTLTGRLPFTNTTLLGQWGLPLLEAAAIVLALRLIGRWLRGSGADDELLFLPVTLLALAGLNVATAESIQSVDAESWLSLALCVLLVALGWLGRRGGLDFRIPEEIWRVDRISSAEN